MRKAKKQKAPQTKCMLSPVQSTRVCLTRTANLKLKEEKFNEWKFRLTSNEYSIVDVFAYPFMAAVIRYLMQSCKQLHMPPSDERRKLNVAAICSCTDCKCDSKEHKAMLSKYEKCGNNIISDNSSGSETENTDSVAGSKAASSEQKSFVSAKKNSSSKAKNKEKKTSLSAKKKSINNRRKKLKDTGKLSLLCNVKIPNKKRKIPLYQISAARKIKRLKLGPLMREIRPIPLKLFSKALKILFLNSNKYEGYFDQMMMNGFGRLKYHNGARYKGKFKNGMAHGFGMMTWQDGTYYQGTMKKNKKHGRGSLVFFKDNVSLNDTNIYKAHFGSWKRGKKHNHGLTVFGKNNWYEGNWENGQMNGFGIRCYREGCYHAGYWRNGLREGYGVMKWPNRDMYYGNWKDGKMHGFGTYIWKAFRVTEWLMSPFQNSYIGEWKNGLRHGKGTLYLSTGAKVTANWRRGKKHGYGEVICTNGKRIRRNNLFCHDKITDTLIPISDPLPKKENEQENKEIALKSNTSPANTEAQAVVPECIRPEGYLPECVAVNAPLYTMDFDPHIYKIFVPDVCPEIYPDNTDFTSWVSTGKRNSIYNLEREWLQKIIIKRGPELNFIYNKYATGGSSKQFEFKPALMRIALWKMLRDGGLFLTKKSLVDLDEEVGIGDKPFDQIAMYEMVHYLLILSWEIFAKQKLFNPNIPGIVASAFDRFIDDVLVPMAHGYCGNILTLFRYVPLKALYTLFNTIKKPVTVGRIEKIIQPKDDSFRDILPRPSKFIRKLAKGLNMFHPDGSLEYLPTHDPYFDLVYEKKTSVKAEGSDLSILGLLGYNIFVQVLLEVLPNIITLEGSIREDYEVTFLDFCDILSELIILYLDKVHGDLDDEDLELLEEEEEEEDEEDEGEDEEDDEEEDLYEGAGGGEEEEMEYFDDNGNGDGDDDDEMEEENDDENVVKKGSEEIAGEIEEEIPGYRKDRLCFDVTLDEGDEDFGEGESSSRLSFLLGDSASDIYKSGQEDQLLDDLRFIDEDGIGEDKEDDGVEGEDNADLVVCEDEEIEEEEEEEEEEQEIIDDEKECVQEHECIEPLENELSFSSENEVKSNIENLSDKIKACFRENTMETSDAHFRSFLNIFLGSKENYKNYPCMAYLEKSKKLMEMFNNLVNKSGLLHKKRFEFIKSRLENEFIKKFINTKLRHDFKKKDLNLESPPIQDTPNDSEVSDDESTISSNVCDNKFFPIETDSSDDWAGKSESTNSTLVSKKSSSSFKEEPEIYSSVSSNSTFTSIMDTDSDNPNYELNYSASDIESESDKVSSSSSPITDTLSSTSDETSIGFTRLGIVCKRILSKFPKKSVSSSKGLRGSRRYPAYKPQLIVHKKKKSRKLIRLKAKKLKSKIAEALFGKDGSRKQYINMLLRLGGIRLLEELKDTLKSKMEINEMVFYKEDFLKNETEELDSILEKHKKEKPKQKLSKEHFVLTSSELNISSEGDKKHENVYDFDRYTHMFDMKNNRPIDYAYFFDIPPIKHPLIVVGKDCSSDDEISKDSNNW